MRSLLNKFFRFALISGVGWLIDFSVYTALTRLTAFPVAGANYVSSLPAITYVFLMSTRKLLACKTDRASKLTKYLVYALYQLALVSAASFLMQVLAGWLAAFTVYSKLAAKILVTPFTMTANFFVLRAIAEKW